MFRRPRSSAGPQPCDPHGASSFHLRWAVPRGTRALVEAWATLEILEAPQVADTYFWALQATFDDNGRACGGAHAGPNGAILNGSVSSLPSENGDPNTRDYAWEAGVPYRIHIRRSPGGNVGWRTEITDLATNECVIVRDLVASGDHVKDLVVWTEVFAPCHAPRVRVRWSDLGGRSADGELVEVDEVIANYESVPAGHCANTNSEPAPDGGIWQSTNSERLTKQGAHLTAKLRVS
jgi:hypothetical protein